MHDQPSAHLIVNAEMLLHGALTKIMPHHGTLTIKQIKSKGVRITASGDVEEDVTSVADEGMGDYVADWSAMMYPDRKFASEERLDKDPTLLTQLGVGDVAVLDDLDGSEWFNRGEARFGVLYNEQTDGKPQAAWILHMIEVTNPVSGAPVIDPKTDRTKIDIEIIMGDRETGVWHSPGIGQDFVRVLPYAERAPKAKGEPLNVIITARYFQPGFLRDQDAITAHLREHGTMAVSEAGIRLHESRSAATLYRDLVLGEIDAALTSVTRPWDNNAGSSLVQFLGGKMRSIDTGADHDLGRYDGGLIGGSSAAVVSHVANSVMAMGDAPAGDEPCAISLQLPPTIARLARRLTAQVMHQNQMPLTAEQAQPRL